MRPSSSLVLRRSLAYVSAVILLLSAPLLAAQSTADAKGSKDAKPAGALPGSTMKATPASAEDFPQQPAVPSSMMAVGSADVASARANKAEASTPGKKDGGTHEGITLSGHWTIDVKNPDGTLAEHRTFENTITPFGTELLVGLMSGYIVPSDYAIYISPNNTGTSPCGGLGCVIVRSLTTLPGSALCGSNFCATTLTYSPALNDNGSTSNTFTLAGSLTATQAGIINTVQSYYGSCPIVPANATSLTTVSPATCSTTAGSGGARSLSAAAITTVNVTANQIIQVTVTFSFS